MFENIHRRKIKVARVMETCTAILESEKYKQQEQRANRVLGLDYFREPREAKSVQLGAFNKELMSNIYTYSNITIFPILKCTILYIKKLLSSKIPFPKNEPKNEK